MAIARPAALLWLALSLCLCGCGAGQVKATAATHQRLASERSYRSIYEKYRKPHEEAAELDVRF